MTTATVELLDIDTARRLTAEARNALAVADDVLARLFAGRVWDAYGHAGWAEYCAAELPELRHLKMRTGPRRERVAALHAAGASVRDMAAATGASVGSVHNDVATITAAAAGTGDPGSSGVAPVPVVARVLAVLAAAGPGGLDVRAVVKRSRLPRESVSPALCRLAASGRVEYRRPARRGQMGTYAVQGDAL